MRTFSWVLVLAAACGPGSGSGPDATGGDDAAVGDADPLIDAPPLPSGPVNVVITADNAYSFGYGTATSIDHFTQGVRADGPAIFDCPINYGPESYVVPEADAPPTAFLYIIAWDDLQYTQGVLAEFSRLNATVLTGDPGFEVCATGLDYSTGPDAQTGPSLQTINAEIARCNAGTGDAATSSKGWVNSAGAVTPGANGILALGETNEDAGGTFPIVCHPTATDPGVRPAARWMWYDPNDGVQQDPFWATGANRYKAFQIFRLGVSNIIF
ncbi:MAG: hypothetical protein SFX73_03210 [Kofleriaceae bacterium]|nr:hypothetical protein [Kofleriaceae bacterium]